MTVSVPSGRKHRFELHRPRTGEQASPMDVVIPIVFPDYLISVDDLTLVQKAAIHTTPGVSIQSEEKTASGARYKVKGLGHAGVAFIDGETGVSKYYEYGRYDHPQEIGRVRQRQVPAVKMGLNKKPTTASLAQMLREIATGSGDGTKISAVYIEVSNKFQVMQKYASDREAQNSDPNRKPYDLIGNNCFTFATQVASAAGVDVSMADKLFPSSGMEEMQRVYRALNFDPASNEVTMGPNK